MIRTMAMILVELTVIPLRCSSGGNVGRDRLRGILLRARKSDHRRPEHMKPGEFLQLRREVAVRQLVQNTPFACHENHSRGTHQRDGCLSGGYVFRTDQLLENWMFEGEICNRGALNINGVLTSRYSSPYTTAPFSGS
jgi:hypothetical protein